MSSQQNGDLNDGKSRSSGQHQSKFKIYKQMIRDKDPLSDAQRLLKTVEESKKGLFSKI